MQGQRTKEVAQTIIAALEPSFGQDRRKGGETQAQMLKAQDIYERLEALQPISQQVLSTIEGNFLAAFAKPKAWGSEALMVVMAHTLRIPILLYEVGLRLSKFDCAAFVNEHHSYSTV